MSILLDSHAYRYRPVHIHNNVKLLQRHTQHGRRGGMESQTQTLELGVGLWCYCGVCRKN